MKTISPQDYDLINDLRSEGLTDLPPGIIEKDLLLTEAIQAVVTTMSDDVRTVFCGGTSLSKAHGLIDRMSEDMDFKTVVPEDMSRNARKNLLSKFKKQLASELGGFGFVVPEGGIRARNENRYISLNLEYKSLFDPVASLRPEIQVELNASTPELPTATLPITSMVSNLTGGPLPGVSAECVSHTETLTEKVLSFLRRTAEFRAGRNRGAYDDRLVRHLYDVRAIISGKPDTVLPIEYFAKTVMGDAVQFKNQYPEFLEDPLGQMRLVLAELNHQPELFEHNYERFVGELVFGDPVPFSEARSAFAGVAERFLVGMQELEQSRGIPEASLQAGAAATDPFGQAKSEAEEQRARKDPGPEPG